MLKDRYAELIARKFAGEASAEELLELEDLLTHHPEAQYFFEIFSEYWAARPKAKTDDVQEEVHFQQILAIAEKKEGVKDEEPEMEQKPATIFTLKNFLAAAVVIGIIVSSFYFIQYVNRPSAVDVALSEVSAKPGAKVHLLLPDGSKVWLNSESKLEYKAKFNDTVREVTLEGEAFFDVVKDKNRPFIVHASDIDVRVLGTAFNLKSYPQESSVEAILIHGLIEVTNKRAPGTPKVIMHPYDKLVFNKQSTPRNTRQRTSEEISPLSRDFTVTSLPKDIADTALKETSWIYNKLVFDGETLRENASKIERWYNVKIRFRDDKAGRTPIRYPLSDETIDEALKALQYIEPFNYRIRDNEIDIWKK